ncbi:MAG: hypothetical protein M0017_04225 [Desulfobacteraceae bacterium]|nr:hypothetical protein [Desulfobacteraceae bacterium]
MNRPPLSCLTWVGLLVCLQIVVVGLIDSITGTDLGFFVFYFLPVGYAAWRAGRPGGIAASVLSALSWWLARHTAVQFAFLGGPVEWWNLGIRLLAFLAFAISTARVKELLEVERELSARLRASLDQVRELRGLLPICASCKKIRDDAGYWQEIEKYIGSHSRAEFTHSICPECARRLYPEFVGDSREKK